MYNLNAISYYKFNNIIFKYMYISYNDYKRYYA